MITFKQFIAEARLAPLYHGTSLENADKIVRSNKFLDATTMDATTLVHKQSGMKQINGTSFSRDYNFSDQFSGYNQYHIIFEVDQQKLGNNYKLLPFNYWSRLSRYLAPKEGSSVRNEYEEFVPGVIEDASKYVTKIIVPNKQTWNYIKASSKFFSIKLHPKLFYNGKFVND